MSNSLDPYQARHFVGPDLGPICLQRLSADDPSRQRVENQNLMSCFRLLLTHFLRKNIRFYISLGRRYSILLVFLYLEVIMIINMTGSFSITSIKAPSS